MCQKTSLKNAKKSVTHSQHCEKIRALWAMGDLNASEESFYSGVYNRIIYITGKLFKNARLNSHLLHIQVIQS